MTKKIFVLITLVATAALLLSACDRSLSKNLSVVPTATNAKKTQVAPGTSVPTDDPIKMLYAYATQTAMANSTPTPQANQTAAPGDTETPEPGNPTKTRKPTAVPTLSTLVATMTPGLPPEKYTLMQGEFPYCIARRFNVNPEELMALNGLTDGQLFEPGLVLKVPQSGNPFPGLRALLPHPATYTVKSGDTIYSIACDYGDVFPEMIAQANGLQPPYSLTTGATLQIP